MFDDAFITIASISENDPPPSFWNEFDIDDFMYRIPLDKDSTITLSDEWRTPQKREEKERDQVRSVKLCSKR